MAIRVVQLGSDRRPGEGLRLGTVRRPPRGVPKSQYASRNFYDVWVPELSPSPATIKSFQSGEQSDARWRHFARRYRSEMKAPERARLLDLLAAMSRTADFAVGCYCEDERRCHRSILRKLLRERGADIADP